jgi:hypothetical protein
MKSLKILFMLCIMIGFTISTGQAMDFVKKGNHSRPFKATIVNTIFSYNKPIAIFNGIGVATHLGKLTSIFTLTKLEGENHFSANVILTAADGSVLQIEVPAIQFQNPNDVNGTWTFYGGTGRFTDVDGEGTIHISEIIIDYKFILTLDGVIDY